MYNRATYIGHDLQMQPHKKFRSSIEVSGWNKCNPMSRTSVARRDFESHTNAAAFQSYGVSFLFAQVQKLCNLIIE